MENVLGNHYSLQCLDRMSAQETPRLVIQAKPYAK